MESTLEMLESLHVSDTNKIMLKYQQFSMIHLGFDMDLWGELMIDYVINRMKYNIDFSVVSYYGENDAYSRFLHNLPNSLSNEIVDIEVAINDFLVKRNWKYVEWKDISRLMNEKLNLKNSSTFIVLLRCYIERYHPNLELNWCLHSEVLYDDCDCDGGDALIPIVPKDLQIYVNLLTLFCDYHLTRNGW